MKISTLSLGILLMGAAGGGWCDDTVPQQVTISRGAAIERAVYKNLDIRIEASNAEMAKTDVDRSWSIYNPVFSAFGNGGVTAVPADPFFSSRTATGSVSIAQTLPTGGSVTIFSQTGFTSVTLDVSGTVTKDWQTSTGVAVTQPLLKNAGKLTTELNIAVSAATHQDSLERFRGVVTDTVASVITAYNHLYVLRQVQKAREDVLKSAQNLLEVIQKRAKPSATQRMDIANGEFALAQRRKDLVEASRNMRDQEVTLRYLMGMEGKATVIPSDPPSREEPKETEDQAVQEALAQRTDLKQMILSLKTSELQEKVAKHQTLPDLTITGGGGATSTGNNFGDSFRDLGSHPGNYWTAGMQFSVPLGNAAAKNDYRKSRIKTSQVHDQIKALSWKIQNDVESDMRALISARLNLQFTDRAKDAAVLRVEEYRKNLQLGTANVQDVLNAENDLVTAQTSQLDAVETFSNAVVKLWKDCGVLLEREGVHIDTAHPKELIAVGETTLPQIPANK